jgi:hypothetical protein
MRLRGFFLSVCCGLAFTASPAHAADPPAWHTGFPATEGSPTDGVSCGTVTFCMVVGHVVAIEDGGPVYDVTSPDINALNAVSCAPGSHFCVAVDTAGSALTFSGQEFGDVEPFAGNTEVLSVSCPAVDRCMALTRPSSAGQFDAYKLNGSGWGAATHLSAPGITSSTQPRVACATETFCVAVANATGGERYWTYNGSGWTFGSTAIPARPVGDTTVSLTCTATNFCLSTSSSGKASRFSGSVWSTVQVDTSSNADKHMASSCFGMTCRALTAGNLAFQTTDGTTWTSPSTGPDPSFAAKSMSCPSADTCVASNSVGDTSTYGLSIVPRSPPVISGTGAVGQTLTISAHSVIDNPNAWFFPEWWRCAQPGSDCTQIPDEHGATYTLTGDDVGYYIDVLEGTGIGLDEELFRDRSNNIAVPAPAPAPPDSGSPGPAPPGGGPPGTGPVVVQPKVSAPRLTRTSTSRRGVVTLSLTCPKGGARCTGALGLSFKSGKKRKSAGSGHYSVAAGKSGKATIRLKSAARKVLRSRQRLSVVLTLKPAGGKATTRSLKLKLPRQR